MLNRCMKCMRELSEDYHFCPVCGYNNYDNSNPERALPLGTVLNNKYLIGAVIGEGSFGITYAAWDILIGIKIAIKEYFPSELVTRDTTFHNGSSAIHLTLLQGTDVDGLYQQQLERFIQEAGNLAKFQKHPGIVSVKDFFYENNTAYMVMENIDGITLSTYLQNHGNKISVKEALHMLEPMMVTLDQIHQAGIIHRDISPDNIMITATGQVKLIDFGAARFVDQEGEKSLTIILKHGYAPEEQYRSNGIQGSWTDVYALCAVMYRMIIGEPPEPVVQRMIDTSDTVHQKLMQVPNLSRQIRNAIEKGLAPKAEKRLQTMRILHNRIYHPSKKTISPRVLGGAIACVFVFVCAEALLLRTKIAPKTLPTLQPQTIDSKTGQTSKEDAHTKPEQLQNGMTDSSEPDISEESNIPEEPEHIYAFREYYNANCVGEIGRVYFLDLTDDSREEMIVVKDILTEDPDSPYGYTVSTPNLTVYQYKDNSINPIYSYQRELYPGWKHYPTEKEPMTGIYLSIQEESGCILTQYWNSDLLSYIEKTAVTDTSNEISPDMETSQEELKQQLCQSVLLIDTSDSCGDPSWRELERLENYQNVLECKENLAELIQLAQTANKPVLDYAHVYEEDTKCTFATTGIIDLTREFSDSTINPLSVWVSYNSQIEKITDIPLGTSDTPAYDWTKNELFQFGKSQHYFVEVSGPGYWIQHKFCFENNVAKEIDGSIYFIQNPDGRVQVEIVKDIEFTNNGNDVSFSNYDYVDIFYYDHQYVEYGTVLAENDVLNQYENFNELMLLIDEEIYSLNSLPDSIFSAQTFEVSQAKLDHIRKSDNDIYYLNYKISGWSPDTEDNYDGWVHAIVEAVGNRLELKENITGEKIIYGRKHDFSDLELPKYMNGEIIQLPTSTGQ